MSRQVEDAKLIALAAYLCAFGFDLGREFRKARRVVEATRQGEPAAVQLAAMRGQLADAALILPDRQFRLFHRYAPDLLWLAYENFAEEMRAAAELGERLADSL